MLAWRISNTLSADFCVEAVQESIDADSPGSGISRQTVQKWLARARAEGRSGLEDRPSRPAHSPTRLSKSKLERIVALRLLRLTAAQIAQRRGLARSTVARHGARQAAATAPTTSRGAL